MIGSIPQRTNKARMVLLSCRRSALSRFGHFRGRPGRRGRVTATVSRVTSRSGTFAVANGQLGGENKEGRYQLRFDEVVRCSAMASAALSFPTVYWRHHPWSNCSTRRETPWLCRLSPLPHEANLVETGTFTRNQISSRQGKEKSLKGIGLP
jgi:hypothetical protein